MKSPFANDLYCSSFSLPQWGCCPFSLALSSLTASSVFAWGGAPHPSCAVLSAEPGCLEVEHYYLELELEHVQWAVEP